MDPHTDDDAEPRSAPVPPDEGAGSDASEPLDPIEELRLLAALDPARCAEELGPERAQEFLADPGHAAAVADLSAFLGAVRAGVAAERAVTHAVAARRVARRVLARTTREQHGWRGDLRLVGDFVADRLRASVWLRIAAAALFVQVTVVPILAWHMLRDARKGAFQVRIERRAPEVEFTPPADVDALEVLSPGLDAALPALPVAEVQTALVALGERVCRAYAADRAAPLSGAAVVADPAAALAAAEGGIERELARRALVLARGGAEVDDGRGVRGTATPDRAADSPPTARLVALATALDRRALLGHDSDLSALLTDLGPHLASPEPDSLAGALKRRAEALQVVPFRGGVGDPDARHRALVPGAAEGAALRAALAAPPGAPEAGDPAAAGEGALGPWARAWLGALAAGG